MGKVGCSADIIVIEFNNTEEGNLSEHADGPYRLYTTADIGNAA